jgi:bifunctional non-homologous end joining protein LigD
LISGSSAYENACPGGYCYTRRKKVFTRNGLDWIKRFTEIAGALAIQREAIIDGEVVVVHEGCTNFSELQAELAAGRQGRLVYYAFDLLWRNGDLRRLPQIERKQALLDLLGENDIELLVLYSEHLTGDGHKMFDHARQAELGGHHFQARGCGVPFGAEQELADDQGRAEGEIPCRRLCPRPERCRGALPRQAEGKDLVYMGKVGTGWSRTVSSQVRKQLDTVVSPKSKLTKTIRKPKATWVEPKFFADVEYRYITMEGLFLRAFSER